MRRRRAWLLAGPAALLLIGAAEPLTPAQRRTLAGLVVCPERLPDDPTRHAAVQRFLAAYARIAPRSRPAERLAFRDRVLMVKRCTDTDRPLVYTVPED